MQGPERNIHVRHGEDRKTTCRTCGAPIRFVPSKHGNWIPVDERRLTVVTDAGEVVNGRQSHFASCPQAEKWRKERRELD